MSTGSDLWLVGNKDRKYPIAHSSLPTAMTVVLLTKSGLLVTGRGIVNIMPVFLKILSYVGMAAMLWVGAGIIVHGIPPVEHSLQEVEAALGIEAIFGGSSGIALSWAVHALILMTAGLATGFVIATAVTPIMRLVGRSH